MLSLRPYQVEALDRSLDSKNKGVSRQVVAHATGLGKTPLFASCGKHHGITKRKLVLAGRESLIRQAADKVGAWNPGSSVGIEMADEWANNNDEFVIASVPTIGRTDSTRLLRFDPKEFGLVVTDECHRSLADSYQAVYRHFGLLDEGQQDILHLGVSATIIRGDGRGLISTFDKVVHSYDLVEGIRDGWLCDLIGEQLDIGTSLDGVGVTSGEFNPSELSAVVNTRRHNEAIARYWMDRAQGRLTVAYCAGIDHAKDMAEIYRSLGVRALAVWGVDPDRDEKLKAFENGEIDIMFNDSLLIEGYDNWRISCILICRPMRSHVTFKQSIGRGTRLPPGINNLIEARAAGQHIVKENCLVLDVTYSSSRHNLASVSSLFGLPPKMSLKGKSLLQAINDVRAVEMSYPNADLSEATDIDNLEAYAKKVDLLSIKIDPNVKANSDFQWHVDLSGRYVIHIPKRVDISITPDVIGFRVEGTVEDTQFGPLELPGLNDAFYFADSMLKRHGKSVLKMLRQSKKPGNREKITPAQVSALKNRLSRLGWPEPDWSKMSMAEGAALFTKLFAMKTNPLLGENG